jgi:hypothetical protein
VGPRGSVRVKSDGPRIYRQGPVWNFWFQIFERDILRRIERDLARCKARVRGRGPLTGKALDEVYELVGGVREDLRVLPLLRTLSRRDRLDLGGPRTLSLHRLWRSGRPVLERHPGT